jgi:hypothetical protein
MLFSSCALQALHVSRAPSFGAVLALWQVTPGLRSVAVVHTCYAWPSWPVAPVVFSILELMSNVLLCRPFDLISRHASLCQARRTTPRQGSRRLRRRDVVYSKDTRRQPQYPEDSLIVTYRILGTRHSCPKLDICTTATCCTYAAPDSPMLAFSHCWSRLRSSSHSFDFSSHRIASQSKPTQELFRFSHPPSPW